MVEAIGDEPIVVLVDNAEHVVSAVTAFTSELVPRTRVTVVTTSRVPLDVPGENLWVVEPLAHAGPAVDLFRATRTGRTTGVVGRGRRHHVPSTDLPAC